MKSDANWEKRFLGSGRIQHGVGKVLPIFAEWISPVDMSGNQKIS